MKEIMKAIGITLRDVWEEAKDPVIDITIGFACALVVAGILAVAAYHPLIVLGIVVASFVLLFIHSVIKNHRIIKLNRS